MSAMSALSDDILCRLSGSVGLCRALSGSVGLCRALSATIRPGLNDGPVRTVAAHAPAAGPGSPGFVLVGSVEARRLAEGAAVAAS
eukprot:5579079-Prymnesium_polylepis.1